MIDLKGRVVLITGASRGIGRAVALLCARAGADVIVNYRNDEKSASETGELCRQHGTRAIVVKADVGNKADVDTMLQRSLAEFGRVDVLVNNAGLWERNPIDDLSDERLRETIDTNVLGTFYPTAAVVPIMKRQGGGVVVNIASTAGQRGEAFHSPYAASKGAVISLTKSLAAELAADNIRVNCVAPGWVITDMSRASLDGPEGDTVRAQIPLGRAATPEEIAAPVLFLASDMATFITGEILNVNGGAVLCG